MIKVLKENLVSPAMVRDFFREFDMMRNLKHKTLLNYWSFKDDGVGRHQIEKFIILSHDVSYIEMEYCSKGTLFDLLFEQGSFTETSAHYLFTQLLDGVSYLHSKGYSHRDLKLENILISDNYHLKIIDFGFCTNLKKSTDFHVGTRYYNPPEIHSKIAYSCPAADLW